MMVKEGYKEVKIGPKNISIPKNWDIVKLKDIAKEGKKTFIDGDWVKSKNMVNDGAYQLIQLGNIGEGNFKGECNKYVSQNFVEENNCTEVEKGDLLISRMASPVLRTIIVPKFNKKSITAVDIVVAKVDEKNWDKRYIKFLLNYKLWKDIGDIFASGSTRQRISRKNMEKINIPYPPLPEQKKIATILSTVDEAIEKTDKIIDETKQLKKGLMQQLLTKGIGHDEFKEVRIGVKNVAVPVEWDIIDFGKVYKKRNERDKSGNYDSYISLGHMVTGETKLGDKDNNGKNRSSNRIFKNGDVLYGKLRPYLDKAVIVNFSGICSTDIIPLYSTEKSLNKYLVYFLHSQIFIDFAISTMEGTNLPRTSWKDIKNLNIPLPPLKEQKKIASILSSVENKIQKEKEYKEQLEQLKKGLMQKLLTGEIRVKVEDKED